MKPLETRRLLLRPPRDGDRTALYPILMDPEVMEFVFSAAFASAAACDAFIEEHFTDADARLGMGTLCLRDGTIIGFAGVIACSVPAFHGEPEFGFVLARAHQGHRHGPEIGGRMMDYVLEELGEPRVLALAHPDNSASHRAIQKLHMQLLEPDAEAGERGRRTVYGMLKATWRAIRASVLSA